LVASRPSGALRSSFASHQLALAAQIDAVKLKEIERV
jgi:hypothetical protein